MRAKRSWSRILCCAALAGAAALAACDGSHGVAATAAPTTGTVGPKPTTSTSTSTSTSTTTSTKPTSTPAGGRSISERLAEEGRSRPAGAVRLEELVASLRERGVTIVRSRQVLADVVGARYCALAMTSHGLGVSACEYDSPEAATAGLATSRAKFDAEIPGRRLLVNGKTLLTVTPAHGSLDEESGTVTTLFTSLAPRT